MRLLNRTHDPDRIRLTFEKLLHTRDDRRRGGAMSAAGVRRDDQNFRDALLLRHSYVLYVPFCGLIQVGYRHSCVFCFLHCLARLLHLALQLLDLDQVPGLNGSDG